MHIFYEEYHVLGTIKKIIHNTAKSHGLLPKPIINKMTRKGLFYYKTII